MLHLLELDPRILPSASASPFRDAPGVPYTVAYLRDGGLIAAAGDGGGPRVVRQDAGGTEVWSVYVADPDTRLGVPPESFRLLLAAGADVLHTETVTPDVPVDLANAVGGTAGALTRYDLDLTTFQMIPAGPTPTGVGLVFREVGDPTERAQLPRAVLAAIGSADVYVASGPYIGPARGLPRYIEVVADGLMPGEIADRVRGVL